MATLNKRPLTQGLIKQILKYLFCFTQRKIQDFGVFYRIN
ncbi:hypothetical protein HC081234_09420 [Helicobacter cinaedi]|nr:hypothetical protein HC081234_09420 [Helicobacter cinaedi]